MKGHKMMRLATRLLTLLLVLAAVACTGSQNAGDDSSALESSDEAQIYAAAIREIQAIAPTIGQVYVVSATEDQAFSDLPEDPSRKLPLDLQEAITAELAGERYELIWIEMFDDAPKGPISPEIEEGWIIAEGDGMVITLGNLHPQDDGSVQLSFFMSCADMCGSGKTYVLNQESGNWRVTGAVGKEIAA